MANKKVKKVKQCKCKNKKEDKHKCNCLYDYPNYICR